MRPITIPGRSNGTGTKPGPLFDWFVDRFELLPWTIPAGSLAPYLPPRDMAPRALERFVLEDADYSERDQIWAAVITRAREPDLAEPYLILALGLVSRGLRAYRNHLPILHRDELLDVDHDLVVGFQRRLRTIPLNLKNLGGRLVNSGVSYARVHWRSHLDRPRAVAPEAIGPVVPAGGLHTAFDTLSTDMAACGTPLSEDDRKLLTLTAIEGHTITEAAQMLDLRLETAYKRRQRAESRIRQHINTRNHQSEVAKRRATPGRGATATAATAESTTRRTAPTPAQPQSTRRPALTAQPANSDHDPPATPHGSDPTTPAPAHPNEPPH